MRFNWKALTVLLMLCTAVSIVMDHYTVTPPWWGYLIIGGLCTELTAAMCGRFVVKTEET